MIYIHVEIMFDQKKNTRRVYVVVFTFSLNCTGFEIDGS